MYMKPENIFAQIAEAGEEEQFDLLFKSQGEATLEFEDRKVTLKKGDYLHIPKNCKHRLDSTSIDPVCVWLCVFDIE